MKSNMFQDLHAEMLRSIEEARQLDLSFVVVTLQNAITCLDYLQQDSEDLQNLRNILGVKDEKYYLRPIQRNQ